MRAELWLPAAWEPQELLPPLSWRQQLPRRLSITTSSGELGTRQLWGKWRCCPAVATPTSPYLMDSSMSLKDRSASSNLLRASWAADGGWRGEEVRGTPTLIQRKGEGGTQTCLLLHTPPGLLWLRLGPGRPSGSCQPQSRLHPTTKALGFRGNSSRAPRAPENGGVALAFPDPRQSLQAASSPLALLKEQVGPGSWAPAGTGDSDLSRGKVPSLPGPVSTHRQ